MEKKLKIVLCILVIVLIAVISFAGVYTKEGVIYKSKLPEYELSSELASRRVTKLVINKETKDVIYDKDGNKVDRIPEDANKDDYRTEQEKINKEEDLTPENFKKVKEIFDSRLKDLGVEDYLVRMDEETGNVIVELAEGISTDTILQDLLCTGDFSITDSEDDTVLLDKSDLKEAKVVYGRNDTGAVVVYLDIIFNKEGTRKTC